MGGTGLVQQAHAGGYIRVDAATVGGAQVAREQPALFQPGHQSRGGALAEHDGVGDLAHLQVPALVVVLSAEHVEE
ncbi:hypothetical protein GCM10020227_09800 [Streptomyces flavovirens]